MGEIKVRVGPPPKKKQMKIPTKKGNFYNFYRDGVTQSMIYKWLQCPHQCYWEYVKGFTTHRNSDAIIFGNCIHHVLEQAYRQIQMPMPGNVVGYIKEFEIKNNDENALSSQQEQNEITYTKAEAVLRNYFIKYAADFLNNWEIAETKFKVPYKFKDGRTTYINGKLDGGFTSATSSGLMLMDHKCKGRIEHDMILTLLPVDLQVNCYLWCVKELNNEYPKGFWYNLIRNPGSKPTKKHKSLREFGDDLSDKIEKDMNHYFHRIPLQIKPIEIDNWQQNTLDPIMESMREWYDSGYKRFIWRNWINTSALETRYGLAPAAKILVENDFTGHYKKDMPFEELKEEDE